MAERRIKAFGCHAQVFVTCGAALARGFPGGEEHVTQDLGMPEASAIASMTAG
jgi:hypothetical protein